MEQLKAYLDQAHSVFHAVAGLCRQLEEAGYTRLSEGESWHLEAGGKYYLTRGGAALMAFRIPAETPKGFLLSASHADRPTFKVKENGELGGKYTRVATERYGGMLIAPWLDRPLSIAGRVIVETPNGTESRLVDIDRDLLMIPNVAIHMNRKANDGYTWNPAVDTIPLLSTAQEPGALNKLLEEAAGGKVLGHDLYLYLREKTSIWGLNEEFISAQALDDLLCAWCCTQGFLAAESCSAIPVLCVFDSEEVGSASLQGADSKLLESTLHRICSALSLDEECMLHGSFMISADNAHAIHPNHPEYADPNNAPVMGSGVVLKFNANQRYVTDGASAAVWRSICNKAGVPLQTYCNRADLPGGSTLGNISLAHVSVPAVDIGLPQLAMHSSYETAHVADVASLVKAMTVYYGANLTPTADGSYTIG